MYVGIPIVVLFIQNDMVNLYLFIYYVTVTFLGTHKAITVFVF